MKTSHQSVTPASGEAAHTTIRGLLKALADNPHVTAAEIPPGEGISEKISAALAAAQGGDK